MSSFRSRLHRHRELIGFSLIVVVYHAIIGMARPLVPLLATDLGASPGMLGVLFSLAAAGALSLADTDFMGQLSRRNWWK